ncbi:hypothetical protein GH5_01074 [Leishmania sp. Ghana 2012 LV757]|uniref:hypothetical protein n=1 Tax=Leishmania sp. Ghana 2012 LV757 TaxID=2803181 RepID=UPI001B53B4AB|nr:hypothetical protein GH5_01074 [Leishmania sp. Ghana 2012 LV757]
MHCAATPRIDKATFRRLWTALPSEQVDRGFWSLLEAFCEPFFDSHSPFHNQTFFSVPRTGRILQEDLTLVDGATVKACNELRPFYNTFTLWNPLALAALLKAPIDVVTAQLLLAVQHAWMSVYFAINCRSCGCDIAHFRSVNDIPFVGTFHATNAYRCPMCTDRTEVNQLSDVAVFFQLDRLPSLFQRQHHRLYYTEEADRRRLESFFCPSQAGFAFAANLPSGRYLLSAPFCGSFVEFAVDLSAQVVGAKDSSLSRIVDLKAYVRSQNSSSDPFGQPIKRRSTTGHAIPRRGVTTSSTAGGGAVGNGGAHSLPTDRNSQLSTSESTQHVEGGGCMDGFGAEDAEEIPPIPVVSLKHGKVQFRIYNDTPHSGFLDLFVSFDTRAEFSANPYPHLFRVPHFMHCLPRGMRSSFLTRCIPRPPSTTPTTGAYVRHQFALGPEQADDPSIISVLREVHRYSLEDHYGLLIGVGDGGASFESTFLSTTAALASSICFFQRVLTRLGEPVALTMRCSVTEGPLKIAAYQGQYNDANNTRSSYPDAQFVGAVVYASNHPPITGPYIYCTEIQAPFTVDSTGTVATTRQAGVLGKYRSPAWMHDENSSYYNITGPTGSSSTDAYSVAEASQQDRWCLIRFEVRCVPPAIDGDTDMSSRHGSVCPRSTLKEDGSDSTDIIFPYFLEFLREHFEGTSVQEEAHALVVQIPLLMIYAALQMSTILDKKAYTKEPRGPF